MKLTVNEAGIFLDNQKVQNCTRVDVENISPINGMEVVLHVHVDEADVQWVVMAKE